VAAFTCGLCGVRRSSSLGHVGLSPTWLSGVCLQLSGGLDERVMVFDLSPDPAEQVGQEQ
jgi:ABC-type dipeptide/oligopeptide/nickel transport system ATPase subunit